MGRAEVGDESDGRDSTPRPTSIVGRARERAAVAALVADSRPLPSALILEGEAGIGKTTLWLEGLAAARRAGWWVVSARPAEAEMSLAYGALGDMLDGTVVSETAADLEPRQRIALEAALRRGTAQPAGDAPVDALALGLAVVAVLRQLADQRPLLVAIDDAHWLDPPSGAALRFAVRRLDGLAARYLLARRPQGGEGLPLGLERVIAPARLTAERLGPLDLDDLDTLLRDELGVRLPRPRLVELRDRTGGNPFYALETARALAGRGALGGPDIRIPPSLTGLLGVRIAALSSTAREILVAAAVATRPTVALVASAVGTERGLREAIDAGLLEVEGDRLRFRHPLLASVAESMALPSERAQAHERLAAHTTEPVERARHLALGAPPDAPIAAELAAAAALAAGRGDPATAAMLLDHAARRTPADAPGDRLRHLVARAHHLVAAGDPDRGRAVLDSLVAELPAGPQRAALLWRLADTLSDRIDRSIALCEQALDEADGDLVLTAEIHTALGVFTWLSGDLGRSTDHVRAAVAVARAAGDRRSLAIALAELAHAETMLGRPYDEAAMRQALAIEAEVADIPPALRPSFQLGIVHLFRDELDEARPLLRGQLERVRGLGDESARVDALYRLADLELRSGRWTEAAALAREAMALARQAGNEQEESVGTMIHGLVQAHLGNSEAAREAAGRAHDLATSGGDRMVATRAAGALGFLALSEGDPAGALRWLTPAVADLRRMGIGELCTSHAVQNEIDALVATAQLAEADERIAWVEVCGRLTARAWHEVVADRGRALVASARGDTGAAVDQIEHALRAHERLPQPFELGRTLLAQGIIERRAKRRGTARPPLIRSLEVFDTLGAALWAERAAAELARIPGRAPAGPGLSVSERRVASLVAAGRSNKEAAAELFVAPRTVEAHLSRIYAKLGIASRAELVRLVAKGEVNLG